MNGPQRPPENGHGKERPAGGGREPEDQRRVEELVAAAGSRPEIPPEHLASIKSAFRAEWRRQIAEGDPPAPNLETPEPPAPIADFPANEPSRPDEVPERPARRWLPLAAALLIALGLGGGWLLYGPAPAPAVLAQVERGAASLRLAEDSTPLDAGQELPTGATLVSGPAGGGALRLANGASLRLDAETRVTLTSAERLDLESGALYLQSEGGDAVAVHTAFGIVREIGTQFEVRLLEPAALRLRVREGRVALQHGSGQVETVTPGAEVTLGPDGQIQRARTEPWADDWRWALDAAPALVIEGRTLRAVLDDIARETGRGLIFENSAVEAEAKETVLHGRLDALAPDRALAAILPGTALSYELRDGGVLWIGES